MNNTLNPRYGYSLIIATILMLFTMVLHPMGGSVAHIQRIASTIMITHAIAILSVPFWLLGFWGLTKRLDDDSLLSSAAFITMSVGLFAVMIAAATNGLALPLFVTHYMDATAEKLDMIKRVVVYNTSLNHAFDLIYTGASCLAVFFWSIAMLKSRRLPVWPGWLGIILVLATIIAMVSGFFFVHLAGFRIFIAGFAVWTFFIIKFLLDKREYNGQQATA
ncbi:MAG: hypothetical protein WDO16_11115 [Bacteroidota bacterium]